MKHKPITLPHVNCSPKNKIPIKNTNPGAKLIKGYALVISNLLIVAIQNNDAIKAAANPDNINGSKIILINAKNLFKVP
jgi:hypothetical protein